MAGGKSQVGCTLGGCFASSVFIIFIVALTVGLLGGNSDSTDKVTAVSAGELTSKIPDNYAQLFKEAAGAFKIDPAILVAIYMTEHHIDSFTKKDLKSLEAVEVGCSSNSSGARGPMQIIDGTWGGVVGKLKDKGIKSPDRCKYRDAFYGGAAVIVGKIKGQPDARRDCDISKDGLSGWTDACVKSVGRAYCGACSGPACGTRGYNYCLHTLKSYKYALGDTAFLPYYILISKGDSSCPTNI